MKGCTKYKLDLSLLDTVSPRKQKFQTYSQSKEDNRGHNKKSSSLMGIYHSKLKQPVCPQIVIENRPTYQSIQGTKSKSMQARIPVSTVAKIHGLQVNSTLDAVNEYVEKVRMNLVKQHKIQQQISKKQLKHLKMPSDNITFVGFDGLQQIVTPINNRNAFISNNVNSPMAYKTMNLLYQTLMEQHGSKRNNKLKLVVSKLPIFERNSMKRSYHSHDKVQQSEVLFGCQQTQNIHLHHYVENDHWRKDYKQHNRQRNHNEMGLMNTTRHRPKLRLRKNPQNKEELQIIPWATQQQFAF